MEFFSQPASWTLVAFIIFVAIAIYLKAPSMIGKLLDEQIERVKKELSDAIELKEEANTLLAEYERKKEDAEKGKTHAENILNVGIKRKKITEDKKSTVLNLINPTIDFNDLNGCDLIVEAVFEDPAIKAEVTKKAESVVDKDCIFATNT